MVCIEKCSNNVLMAKIMKKNWPNLTFISHHCNFNHELIIVIILLHSSLNVDINFIEPNHFICAGWSAESQLQVICCRLPKILTEKQWILSITGKFRFITRCTKIVFTNKAWWCGATKIGACVTRWPWLTCRCEWPHMLPWILAIRQTETIHVVSFNATTSRKTISRLGAITSYTSDNSGIWNSIGRDDDRITIWWIEICSPSTCSCWMHCRFQKIGRTILWSIGEVNGVDEF